MLSQNNLKNKIVFAVAIGFLLTVVQCRPFEQSVDKVPEVLAAAVPVKETEIKNADAVKEIPIVEAPKDTTILSVVPEVAVIHKKDDSSAEDSMSFDSSSAESSESKITSNESSEEVKLSPVVPVEITIVADVAAPAPAAGLEPVVLAMVEPAIAVVKEIVIEPVVSAIPSEPTVSVALVDMAEPVKTAVDVVIEPAMKTVAAEPVIAEEKPATAVAVEVPESANNIKTTDAAKTVKPLTQPQETITPEAVVDQKVIIVTPSSNDVVPAIVPVVDVKIDKVQENVASVAPDSPAAAVIVQNDAIQSKEAPAVTSEVKKSDN